MAEYHYSQEDRRNQLELLQSELKRFLPLIQASPRFSRSAWKFEEALAETQRLLETGFTQAELSALGRSVPDLLDRHPHFEPPLVRATNGRWIEAAWYVATRGALDPLLAAARELIVLGYWRP